MEKLFKFLMWTLGIFAVLVLIGRAFLFEMWTIPDDEYLDASMAPTLAAGDTVLVLTRGESTFGDLVRCPDPEEDDRWVVGRIVGLGGDAVQLRGPSLKVNGTPYNASDACTEPTFTVAHPDTGHETEMNCSRVEMGGRWHYRGTPRGRVITGSVKKDVGTGKVYLLSDNRMMHEDSRDFGSLEHDDCHQRIFFRLWGAEGWTDSKRRLDFIR